MDYTSIAKNIRKDVIRSIARAGKGHTAGNLSSADIFTTLYFGILKHNPRKPDWEERDRVFASEHLNPAWNTTLAHAGYFSKRELFLPQKEKQGGLSIAVGSALAAKIDNKKHQTYCILSDHELNGENWEAIMLAGKHKLSNMTLIIDRNNIQAEGYTEELMPLEPLRAKYEAFNWNAIEVDGHNHQHIFEALNEAKNSLKPTVIIAHTIAGKGISFIENKYEWHAKAPTNEEEQTALNELNDRHNN